MKKYKSDAKTVLNRLGKLSGFLTDLDANANKNDGFEFPLEIIRQTMMFDVSVLYKVSNVIENRLILEIVKILDPDGLRPDLEEGRKLRLFLDDPDMIHINEVKAFLNKRVSHINVAGVGCDIIGYVHFPESCGGAYLVGGDFCGNESSVKDYEVACVEIMCNLLSAILLKIQFKYQAEYDNLTGLFNSAKIKQKVEIILKRFERKSASIACIAMGDIDFFKKINDTYGHIQGDLVLKKVGDLLSNSMRGVFDVAGRYGGEEFLLIFDEADEKKTFQIIERLRKIISDTKFEKMDRTGKILNNEYLNITMSFGISQLSKDSGIKIVTDWISRADIALYESKQNGRNKTSVYRDI
ncbi:GGDEF domain-containing protein [Desulfobacula phenolica]|uniref:diguanylate cyclase n=1 Tax=Desulfobacula phenolica TaxID=90732 RepID=A0A1H2JZU2_9BACT|nr:GGDEF domain-containing protein [Desulfobacula phenolica]SDU61832.1 diguanylate cyclase (GGDEF) domain-containing protein [Desulfobacula phenolica]